MSQIAVVTSDLMTLARIASIVERLGHEVHRVDHPAAVRLGASTDVVAMLVSWDEREPGWAEALANRVKPADSRGAMPWVVLFGSHRDLDGHRQARSAGLGRVVARSALRTELRRLFGGHDPVSARGA